MRTILKIARAELSLLFYSPIAWLLGIVFIFQCSLTYVSNLQGFLTYQQLGSQYASILTFLTHRIFTQRSVGLLPAVIDKIYLYIPLLTMGLISREINSGTIKLLYSSPIKVRQIVFGKFVAMMGYSLLLILIVFGLELSGIIVIHSADIGLLLSGLLGIYLLLCTYSAIGLFMSSLSSYQIVAALGTLVLFAVLDYIGVLWQGVDLVRDLTYFLSISGRTNHMVLGLISTKDVFYFLLIIYLFLGFTIVKLQAERKSGQAMATRVRYVGLFVSVLVAGYLTGLPVLTGYYDATKSKLMTLTNNSQKIIRELGNDPLDVVVYSNMLDAYYLNFGMPDKRNEDLARWEPYLRYKPDIKFKYVYYYDIPNHDSAVFKYNPGKTLRQIAETNARAMNVDISDFKTPEQIRKIIDLSKEDNRYVMQLSYKGKSTFLRFFEDNTTVPSETEIDAALKRLTAARLPRVAFLSDEYERSKDKLGDREYGILSSRTAFRYALVNQGFDVETVSLQNGDIPDSISTLVIADPKTAFTPEAMAKIGRYIDRGGNLLIAGEPGKQAILNPVLQSLGVKLVDGQLVQKSKDFPPNVIKPLFTPAIGDISRALYKMRKDSVTIAMPGTAGLSYTSNGGFTVRPVTMTDARYCWNKLDKLTVDSADVAFSAANGDQRESVPTILALTRKLEGKEQRILVTGDADFMSNIELTKSAINFEFSLKLFGWFTNGQFPIDTTRPDSEDDHFNLTDAGMTMIKLLFLGIIPGALLLIATIFLLRRKRK